MESADIYLKISSPESQLLGMMVGKVSLPGVSGAFTVLRNHAPLISALREGDIVYTVGEKSFSRHILSGFVEVADNTVSVCAEV